MLSINYRYTKNIVINEDIPKDVIINIFRPYLHLYYLHRFGVCGTEKKHESYTKLKNKLKQFAEFNPQFGRKIIKIEKKYIFVNCSLTNNPKMVLKRIKTCNFNLKHIDFYKNNINNLENQEEEEEEEEEEENNVAEINGSAIFVFFPSNENDEEEEEEEEEIEEHDDEGDEINIDIDDESDSIS
jgi:hypothetical protein